MKTGPTLYREHGLLGAVCVYPSCPRSRGDSPRAGSRKEEKEASLAFRPLVKLGRPTVPFPVCSPSFTKRDT